MEHASKSHLECLPERKGRTKGRESCLIDDGGARVDGRVFGEREEGLNIVVAVFQVAVVPLQNGREGAAKRIRGFFGVEADEERSGG